MSEPVKTLSRWTYYVKTSRAYAKLQSLLDTDPLVQRDTEALTAEWTDLSKCFMDAVTASLGFSTKKHQDWFDSNNASIMQLLSEKCRSCCQASKSVI